MQDIRIFGGGGGGGGAGLDRRMRAHTQHHNLQALKCPRCDSLNTKFCYYNNYNLSQPRHFCKSCRRYWTKGGVLRNVPVGGGCRKTKRSSKAKPATSESVRKRSSNSHSSSESSSLTAATEAVSAPPSKLVSVVDDSKLLECGSNNLVEQGGDRGIFSEIGSFTSLITSTNDPLLFGLNNQEKMGLVDETLQLNNNVGFGSLDWQGGGSNSGDHQGLFDQVYWSQTQWTDQYHPASTLYFP